MTAPTSMVYYNLGQFSKEGLWENCATDMITSSSLTKASMQKDRVISATMIGQIKKLATSFVWCLGYWLACRLVWVAPNGRTIVNSAGEVVPHQRNQERSSPQVNSGAIVFRLKWCLHYEKMFWMTSTYLVSMGNTCRTHILLMRDINIEVPSELYWNYLLGGS